MSMNPDLIFFRNIVKQCTFFDACSKLLTHKQNDIGNDDEVSNEALQTTLPLFSSSSGIFIKPQIISNDETIPVKIFNQPASSVSMSERKQREMHSHCGARTLFVGPAKTEKLTTTFPVLLRGANKFFDLQHAFHQIETLKVTEDDHEQQQITMLNQCKFLPLRKAAGFFCIFFCDDAEKNTIRCSSKHSLSGIHVEVATRIFHAQFKNNNNNEQNFQALLCRYLFENKLALLCECVIEAKKNFELFSSFHPCDDSDFAQGKKDDDDTSEGKIVCFAIQKMNTVEEWSLPHSEFIEKIGSATLNVVPTITTNQSNSSSSLRQLTQELVSRATRTIFPFSEDNNNETSEVLKGEGVVLLIDGYYEQKSDGCCINKPIRLKIKTAQYQCARQLRSLFESKNNNNQDEDNLIVSRSSSNMNLSTPLLLTIAIWYLENISNNNNSLSTMSWEQVLQQFYLHRQSIDPANKILQMLDRDACLRYRAQLLNPKFLILLSGLPGSGKSSISNALKKKLIQIYNNDSIKVSIIERDSFVPALPPGSSNHALRAARKSAHRGFMKALRLGQSNENNDDGDVVKQKIPDFSLPKTPHVIIADACHASRGARDTTRDCVGPYRLGVTCYLHCADRKKLVLRILKRKSHRVLAGGEENVANVEKAIFDVASMFDPPNEKILEGGDAVMRFNVLDSSASQIKNAEEMANEIYENHLKRGIDNFLEEMQAVENLDARNNNSGDKSMLSFDHDFFFNNNGSTKTPTSITSFADFISKLCPPPKLLTVRLVPPKEESQEWRTTLLQQMVLPSLKKVMLKNSSQQNSVVAGHTKWIEPYFKLKTVNFSANNQDDDDGNERHHQDSTICDDIVKKFQSDYNSTNNKVEESVLHVTLLHSRDFAKKSTIPESLSEYWRQKEKENSVFRITPRFVALDRRMLAIEVEIKEETRSEDSLMISDGQHQKILHITLAHSSKVEPSYAMELLRRRETTAEVNLISSGGTRRQRENDDGDYGREEYELSKNQSRKQCDKQFCILNWEDEDGDEKNGEEKISSPCLFGVVECSAK